MSEVEYFEPKERRLLIDGDVLIHMACWKKPISKKEAENRQIEIDELRAMGCPKSRVDKHIKRLEEDKLTYQPRVEQAKDRFRHFVQTALEENWTELFSLAIGEAESNWRLEVHPEYKKQKARAKGAKKRAPYIQELREWAVEEFDGHYCVGYEADDAIRSWAYRLGEDEYVVCSVDKDLNLISGRHHDPKIDARRRIYWKIGKEEAAMFFWEQMLTGDPMDNIPGIEGIGPKKAKDLLEGCKNEQDCKEVVVQQYDLKYGNEGYSKLMFNGKLLHIWRWREDYWAFDKKEYEEITGTKP